MKGRYSAFPSADVAEIAAAARGEAAYLKALGVTDPDTVARILTIQYLQNLPNPPQNVIVSTGGDVQPSVPTK